MSQLRKVIKPYLVFITISSDLAGWIEETAIAATDGEVRLYSELGHLLPSMKVQVFENPEMRDADEPTT